MVRLKRSAAVSVMPHDPMAAALALVAVVALWPGLWVRLGLHGDEAWVGLAGYDLLHGKPLRLEGMNSHTGPLHHWLVYLSFKLFGVSELSLRAVGACTNAAALALWLRALKPIMGTAAARWTAALGLALPFVLTFGAVAIEHFALSPLLGASAVFYLVAAVKQPEEPRLAVWAGVLLGLGTWTHLVFAAVPAGLAAAAAAHWGTRALAHPVVRRAALAWLLVEAIPLINIGRRIKIRGGGHGLFYRLVHAPQHLVAAWRGDAIVWRVVGAAPGPQPLFTLCAGLMALGCLALMVMARPRARHVLRVGVAALGGMLVGTSVVVPFLTERYMLMALWLLPLLWVQAAFAMAALVPWAPWRRLMAHGLCATLLVLQLGAFVGPIMRPLRAGEQVGNFYLTDGRIESSNHYMDVRPLYDALTTRPRPEVVTQNFIGWSLSFYDLDRDGLKLTFSESEPDQAPSYAGGPNATYVTYKDGFRNLFIRDIPPGLAMTELGAFLLFDPKAP